MHANLLIANKIIYELPFVLFTFKTHLRIDIDSSFDSRTDQQITIIG